MAERVLSGSVRGVSVVRAWTVSAAGRVSERLDVSKDMGTVDWISSLDL